MKQYKKIEIFVDNVYICTTTRSKTCKEAKARYCEKYGVDPKRVKANFKPGV